MSAPLYFFPGLRPADLRDGRRPKPEPLVARGLGDVLRDVQDLDARAALWEVTGDGPGGAGGTILTTITADSPPPRLAYAPAEQDWVQVWADPPLWIGVDRQRRPTPADLARPEALDGYTLELADGQRWAVPTIRRPDGRDLLPHDLYRDASGEFQSRIKPAYISAWDRTAPLVEAALSDRGLESIDEAAGLDHATFFLGLNYRYGQREQMALRLVDSTNWASVVLWALGWPLKLLEEERLKKTGPP